MSTSEPTLLHLAEEAVKLLQQLATQRNSPASTEDLLTLAEVVRRLPVREQDARRWVRERVQPRRMLLGARTVELYRWGDVLDALERSQEQRAERPAQASPPWQQAPKADV